MDVPNIMREFEVMLKRPQCHTQTVIVISRFPVLPDPNVVLLTNDEREEQNRAVFAEDVEQDLQNRLPGA